MCNKTISILLCITVLGLGGCATGYKDYARAVKEQNMTIQLQNEKMEREKIRREELMENRRMEHREKMAKLLEHTITATAKTKDRTDDVIAPLLIATLEDKWAMADMIAESKKKESKPMAMHKIEAPEKTSDIIKASTAPVLGALGIYAGIRNTDALADVAVAGISNAGVHNTVSGENNRMTTDSYKSNTDNTVNGNENTLNGGKVGCSNCDDEDTEEEEELPEDTPEKPKSCTDSAFYENGTWWIVPGCSCESRAEGRC